jgi:hypothetical protein
MPEPAEYIRKLQAVAHAAWHLMDDSGETGTFSDNGRPDHWYLDIDHQYLSEALDALEATGWNVHPNE